ncbi:hypothetical protein ACIQ6Y_34735 [Streptomyces sp. NPDC096205]|uniref:hypothetical protein n=1 Tax=Streptomyces sp. NPDC096205 TaxID=3366081 RepID=UPI0037FBF254
MNVEIDPLVRETAARLGAGVPYALKAVAGLPADDPDLGRPSGLPGILTVTLDGDMVEDCPALAIGYIREPDRVEIRYVSAVPSPEPATVDNEGAEQVRSADPATDALVVREVADAWHRIIHRLLQDAPDSYAALRAGATPADLAALEDALDTRRCAEPRHRLEAHLDPGHHPWRGRPHVRAVPGQRDRLPGPAVPLPRTSCRGTRHAGHILGRGCRHALTVSPAEAPEVARRHESGPLLLNEPHE